MRFDKYKKINTFTRVFSVIYVLALAAFIALLFRTDMLPANFLYGILAAIGVLSLIIFPTLYFKRVKLQVKIVSLILSVLLMGTFCYAAVNLNQTVEFLNKATKIGVQTEDYYVVVPDKGEIETVKDLDGKKVVTYLTNEINYSTAKGMLSNEAAVEYKMESNLSKIGKDLLVKKSDAIFVSTGHYKTLSEGESGFKDKTRIIHTVMVEIENKDISKRVDVTKEPFNIYVSGLDISGKIGQASRSDVNMIVTVNPKSHKVLLTSIPRDYQIRLTSKDNAADKLTHTGIYGVQETVGSIEDLTGLTMNYYLKVNYSTVRLFVDAIGGVDVENPEEFYTHGQAAQYFFPAGNNHLDGEMALAFARERKSFDDGDLQRNKNQQLIVEAIIKKATSSKTVLTRYTKILEACENYMEINMTGKEIRKLVKWQLKEGGKWKVEKQSMEGEDDMTTCYSSGDYMVYVMTPTEEQIVKAVDAIMATMDD